MALLAVAIALGLNNFAASIAIGVSGVDRRTGVRVAVVFGLFDTVMPAIGLLIGHRVAGDLGHAARWTGAGVLAAAGVYGLAEALGDGDDMPRAWHGWRLLISGAALSLDDLAVGFALGALRVPVAVAVIMCGAASIVMSMIGLELGGKIGTATGDRGEVVGAVALLCVAIVMAAGWLLPRRKRRQVAVLVQVEPAVLEPGTKASRCFQERPRAMSRSNGPLPPENCGNSRGVYAPP